MARPKSAASPAPPFIRTVAPAPRDAPATFVLVVACVEALRRAARAVPRAAPDPRELDAALRQFASTVAPTQDREALFRAPCAGEAPDAPGDRATVLSRYVDDLQAHADCPGVSDLRRLVAGTAARLRGPL